MVLSKQDNSANKIKNVSVSMTVGTPVVSISKQANSYGKEDLYTKWCNSRNVSIGLRQNLKDVNSTISLLSKKVQELEKDVGNVPCF